MIFGAIYGVLILADKTGSFLDELLISKLHSEFISRRQRFVLFG